MPLIFYFKNRLAQGNPLGPPYTNLQKVLRYRIHTRNGSTLLWPGGLLFFLFFLFLFFRPMITQLLQRNFQWQVLCRMYVSLKMVIVQESA